MSNLNLKFAYCNFKLYRLNICIQVKKLLVLFWLILYGSLFSQTDSNLVLNFNFNNGIIKEENGLSIPRAVGVSLTEDRFGNKNHAVYIQGNNRSYLNLGTSAMLKPKKGSISVWFKLDRCVHIGKGYKSSPIIITKSRPGEDFVVSYQLFVDGYTNRLTACSTQDSTNEVLVSSKDKFEYSKWYHAVITFDDNWFKFYINGQKEAVLVKDFTTMYMMTDSVVVGHTASHKNERFSIGTFDDIQIFHRILTDLEVLELYNSENPDKNSRLFAQSIKYIVIIITLVLVSIILLVWNKIKLKVQKNKLELANKISELELQVIKSQMNPHFISNSLAAIQELIINNNIEKATFYLAKFGYFMRKVMNYSDKNLISLEKELEVIRLNVELEQLRFKNKFEYVEEISGEVDPENTLVPALISQPFIENAIWHGLLKLNEKRGPILKVSVYYRDNCTIIEVKDNGVGRTLTDKKERQSMGTKLVSDKIQALNKLSNTSNYKLSIIDLKDHTGKPAGTKVVMQFDKVIY